MIAGMQQRSRLGRSSAGNGSGTRPGGALF